MQHTQLPLLERWDGQIVDMAMGINMMMWACMAEDFPGSRFFWLRLWHFQILNFCLMDTDSAQSSVRRKQDSCPDDSIPIPSVRAGSPDHQLYLLLMSLALRWESPDEEMLYCQYLSLYSKRTAQTDSSNSRSLYRYICLPSALEAQHHGQRLHLHTSLIPRLMVICK